MLLMSLERKVLRDSVQQKGLSSLVICFQLDSAKLRRRGVIPNQEADIMPGLEAFVRMVPAPQGVLEHTVSNVSMRFRKALSKPGQSLGSSNLWHGSM